MDQPLVSIIIPCFRQGQYLRAAIDSALGQGFPAVQVVVINDGSDDRTDEVARSYGERIRYIDQPNQGQAAARNVGAIASTGTYLLFLDADDKLHPNAVEWLVEAAGGRDDVLCAMGVEYFEQESVLYERKLPPKVPNLSALLLTKNFAGPPCAFLCTRARFESCGGFDTELQGTEDWDLWASLVFAGCEVVPVFRIGAYYRVHSTSWTRNQLRMGLQYALYHRRVLARIRENPERVAELGKLAADLSRDVRGQLADALWGIAYFCRNEGRYWSAFYFYLASLRWGRLTAIVGIGKLIPHRLLRTSTDGRPSPLATLKKAGTTP